MCGLIGTFDNDRIYEFVKLNADRGDFSYSITVIDYETNKVNYCIKNLGKFSYDVNNLSKHDYKIVHMQAPTNGLDKNFQNIHPSKIKKSYLWHNGILKNKWYNKLKKKYNNKWDTYLLHNYFLDKNKYDNLDASFSCFFLNKKKLKVFRNEDSILYYDSFLNISSNEFKNSKELPAGKIYKIDLKNKELIQLKKFKCETSPYYFSSF